MEILQRIQNDTDFHNLKTDQERKTFIKRTIEKQGKLVLTTVAGGSFEYNANAHTFLWGLHETGIVGYQITYTEHLGYIEWTIVYHQDDQSIKQEL